MSNKRKGNFGESLAAWFLILKGYKILERNFSVKGGELDIIAEKKGTIVIIEVKTRQNADYGSPEDAVNLYKKRNIITATKRYLRYCGRENSPVRFDVISILLKPLKIKHLKDAFFYDDV